MLSSDWVNRWQKRLPRNNGCALTLTDEELTTVCLRIVGKFKSANYRMLVDRKCEEFKNRGHSQLVSIRDRTYRRMSLMLRSLVAMSS